MRLFLALLLLGCLPLPAASHPCWIKKVKTEKNGVRVYFDKHLPYFKRFSAGEKWEGSDPLDRNVVGGVLYSTFIPLGTAIVAGVNYNENCPIESMRKNGIVGVRYYFFPPTPFAPPPVIIGQAAAPVERGEGFIKSSRR